MKKILLSLGTAVTIIAPVATMLSCNAKMKKETKKVDENNQEGTNLPLANIFQRTLSYDVNIDNDFKINTIDIDSQLQGEATPGTQLISRCVQYIFDPIGYGQTISISLDETKGTSQAKEFKLNFNVTDSDGKINVVTAKVINSGNRDEDVKKFSIQFHEALASIDHLINGFKKEFDKALVSDGFPSLSDAFKKFEHFPSK